MTAASNIVDVTAADFEREVIEKSSEIPVLVDFWAGWCQPCGMLAPILERVAESFGDSLRIVKRAGDAQRHG